MSILDVIIILFCLGALARGFEIGFVRQAFSTVGFFGGLFLGGLLQSKFVVYAHTPLGKTAVTLACTLGCALILLAVGESIGIYLKRKLKSNILGPADGVLGSVLSVLTILVIFWLLANLVASLPNQELRRWAKSSAIITHLNDELPPAPQIIASLSQLINPNGFPDVFAGKEPPPGNLVKQPGLASFKTAIAADRDSVVKITGEGCGGLVEGSGFVVGQDLVATNAHVVAGIDKINVIDDNGYHTAVPIWFDPNLDFAVLRVSNLDGKPLDIKIADVADNTSAAIMGYPGGGNFQADSAVVRDEFTAIGRNIYGQGRTARNVYEIQAIVRPGNSGGPLINQKGQVLGVVFAESTNYNKIGYTLTSSEIVKEIRQARQQNRPVGTGSCAE